MPTVAPVRSGALAFAVALLAACTTLPPQVPRQASYAIPDGSQTTLGRIANRSMHGALPIYSGFRLLPYGPFALQARLALAARAEKSLDVQYYLLQNDATGRVFLRALRDAAVRGVRVRLLLDDFYTAGEDDLLAEFASYPNVEVRLYNPFSAGRDALTTRLLFSIGDFWRIDHRMHNKLFVADNVMSISGGRNIADPYFTLADTASNFVDLDIFAAGPVVKQLSGQFDRYWNDTYAYPLDAIVPLPTESDLAQAKFERDTQPDASTGPLPDTDALGHGPLQVELAKGELALHWASASAHADSPDKAAGINDKTLAGTVTRSIEDAITQARSEIIIASPYLVPGKRGMRLIAEARARGVRVVLITNSLAATDEPIVEIGYRRFRKKLLEQGVEIYELSPTLSTERADIEDFRSALGRLHAKVWVIDHRRLFVGSMNLDARSAHINTETGIIVNSPELAGEVIQLLGDDLKTSAYEVRLGPQHQVQWVTHINGRETVYDTEPGVALSLQLELLLLSPLAPEELM